MEYAPKETGSLWHQVTVINSSSSAVGEMHRCLLSQALEDETSDLTFNSTLCLKKGTPTLSTVTLERI